MIKINNFNLESQSFQLKIANFKIKLKDNVGKVKKTDDDLQSFEIWARNH